MKRNVLVVLFAMAIGAGLFAHNAGDLGLNFGFTVGVDLPDISYEKKYFSKDADIITYGIDGSFRTTLDFNFLPIVSVNTGVGIGGFCNFYTEYIKVMDYGYVLTYQTYAAYLVIPLGIRFTPGIFVLGAGIAQYIPLSSNDFNASWDIGGTSTELDDDGTFGVNSFMGWYVNIGFDKAGGAGRTKGFGLVFQVAGSFSDKIASGEGFNAAAGSLKNYKYLAYSLVLNYSFKAANVFGNKK